MITIYLDDNSNVTVLKEYLTEEVDVCYTKTKEEFYTDFGISIPADIKGFSYEPDMMIFVITDIDNNVKAYKNTFDSAFITALALQQGDIEARLIQINSEVVV